MNNPERKIDQQLEARLVALALGEASDFEREELERLIAERSDVQVVFEEIQEVHSLLQFIGEDEWPDKTESDDANDSWKLPESKRDAVVSVIEGKSPAIQVRVDRKAPTKRRRGWKRVAGIAATLSGVAAVLFVFLLPIIQGSREAARRGPTASAPTQLGRSRHAADAKPSPAKEAYKAHIDRDGDGNADSGFFELYDGAVPGSQVTNGRAAIEAPAEEWESVAPQLEAARESVFQSGGAASSDYLVPSEGKVRHDYKMDGAPPQDSKGDGEAWSLSGGTNLRFRSSGESGQGKFGNSSQGQEGQQGEQSSGPQQAGGGKSNRGGQGLAGSSGSGGGALGSAMGGFGSGGYGVGGGGYGGGAYGNGGEQGGENAESGPRGYAGKDFSGAAVNGIVTVQDGPADMEGLAKQLPSSSTAVQSTVRSVDESIVYSDPNQWSELTRRRRGVDSSGNDVGRDVASSAGEQDKQHPVADLALPVVDGFNGLKVDNLWTDGLTMPNGSFGEVRRYEEGSQSLNELSDVAKVPATGTVVRNKSAIQSFSAVDRNEYYTVDVPTSEQGRTERYAVTVPYEQGQTQQYTVNVPAREQGRLDLYTGSLPSSPATLGFEAELAEQDESLPTKGLGIDQGNQPYGFYLQKWSRHPGSGEEDFKKSIVTRGLDEKLAAKEPFSTFSLHVSDVSFKLARAALAKGQWPETTKIRVEEFVNAFDYGDPLPCHGERVACSVEQAIHPFLQQRNVLRVSMRTAATGRSSTTPLRLTFLLDNSGSMERIDRQETVRQAFAMLAQQLKPIDQVTLISFARETRLLADKVSGAEAQRLIQRIQNLPSEGGTNIEAALQLAHDKAKEQFVAGAQNRIILLTDGAVNLGNADPESLSQKIVAMREQGIAFDAAGISADGLNDEVLEALTRKGDGRYYLLDSVDSADDGFAKQIAGALRPSAKNVKVQIEFNPHRVGNYKLLGFEKHRLKKEDFRNDKVDAAEMAAAEAGVAVYQFEARPDGVGDVGSVSVRFLDVESGRMVENRWPIPYQADAQRMDVATPSLRIATSAAMLASKLRGDPVGQTVEMKSLSNLISGLPPECRNGRVQELEQMIQQTRQLQP